MQSFIIILFFSILSAFQFPALNLQVDSILPVIHSKNGKHVRTVRGNTTVSILSNLASIPSLSKLYSIIQENSFLADALAAPDANITLFAPVNSAIPQTLAENLDETLDMLLYHIVHPSFSIDDFEDGQLLESGLNLESLGDKPQRIQVFRRNEHISLNWHVKVESLSIQASNGWIHLVDSILKPPSTLPSHLKYFPFKFSMLAIALRKTGVALILNEINGVTFFAPTNSAFLKLGWLKLRHLFSDDGVSELASILLHHMTPNLLYSDDIIRAKELYVRSLFRNQPLDIVATPSGDIIVNDESKVVGLANQLGNNGVLHPVDHVIMPNEEFLNSNNE